MPTIINGNTGIDQVTNNTLVVADAKSGETVGFQKMQLFAAKATTTGTFVDFSPADGTGIPSWVKKITVTMRGVSTNGTSVTQLQLGTSAGLETTGYTSTAVGGTPGNVLSGNHITTGIIALPIGSGANLITGVLTLVNIGGNVWVSGGNVFIEGLATAYTIAGTKTLSGLLDRIRLTTVNGTDTFDAGSVSILVEGYE